jgi:ribosomal protein S18 acetylase RimI-like enzyme
LDQITITRASITDLLELQNIGITCFKETFSSMNSEENMNAYLQKSFSTAQLISELSDPNSEFYIAKLNALVIGYLKVNSGEAQTEIKDQKSLEIERIYVLSKFHGKKFGQLLYEKALAISKQKKVSYVWLGVWEKNQKAILFYQKNGFAIFDTHIFKLGNEVQTDFMMKLELQ